MPRFHQTLPAAGLLAGLLSLDAAATDFGFTAERGGTFADFVVVEATETAITSLRSIPYPLAESVSERARDGVRLDDGGYAIYNGTFEPVLSVYRGGGWRHFEFAGWSTVNNGSYGGIASDNRFVFVTDMDTAGPGDEAQGVIRFDLEETVDTVRFAGDIGPIDLTLGRDGRLYLLYPGGSPAGRFLDVYDPLTLAKRDTVDLTAIFGHTEHRSIAVDAEGDIFIADWDGDIQRIDSAGNVLAATTIDGSSGNLYDIDLVGDNVIVGNRFGEVFIADRNLTAVTRVAIDSLDSALEDRGVFILGESVDLRFLDRIFGDQFEPLTAR